MEVNELIERYVHEVGRNLPRKMRADIELELSSLVHDALEERAAAAGKEPTSKMAADVLREMGKPETMAAQYRPEQHLIGPQLFPIYKLVLTIVLVIITVVHVAGLVFMLLRGETAVFGWEAWAWFTNYFQSAALNFGIITLIFAAIERAQIVNLSAQLSTTHPLLVVLRRERAQIADLSAQPPTESDWNPLDLPAVEDPDRVNRFELAFGMMWTVAFIILFNFYPEWLGVVTFSGDETNFFRLFAPAFAVHVPWLTLSWILELGVKGIVLTRGRWTRLTRWLQLAIIPLDIYILNRIRTGGEIFTIDFLTRMTKWGLGIIIVIVVLDGLYKLYKVVAKRPFPPIETIKSKMA